MAQEADTTMDERIKAFVGWDAYKDCISVPARDAGRETARFCWHDGAHVGYGRHRELATAGCYCDIVAPVTATSASGSLAWHPISYMISFIIKS